MAKARQRRRSSNALTTNGSAVGAPTPAVPVVHPRLRSHATRRHGSRPGWQVELAVFALVVGLGLVGWWGYSAARDNAGGTTSTVRPIATLRSQDIHSLLVDPADPNHVLFGSHSGVQESRDGGFTWEAGSLRNADAMSLAASPQAPATLYAAGHNVFQVSQDGGQSWQPVKHNLPGTDLHAFAQDPNDPRRLSTLVAGVGLFASSDGGASWAPLPTSPPGGGMHLALAAGNAALYAATEAGIVVTRDGGATWERLPGQPEGGVMSLAIPVAAPETLYAGTSSGLAKSTDGGASWAVVGPAGVPALALAVAPSDPNRVLFVADGGGVYRSDDGGTSWLVPR
ncbi:MAG: YCF48-related protein [Chloroflexota bacterium]|nr:YCF48-related protein [Chloroflexota bacterium]